MMMTLLSGISGYLLLLLSLQFVAIASRTAWSHSANLMVPDDASSKGTGATSTTCDQQRSICPASCGDTGLDSIAWTVYHHINQLAYCDQTMILDFALHNPLGNPQTRSTIRCCTAGAKVSDTSGADANAEVSADRDAKRDAAACIPNVNLSNLEVSLQIAFNGSGYAGSVSDFVEASQQMAQYMGKQNGSCEQTVVFAYSGSAAVGLFAGSALQNQGVAESVLRQFISAIASTGYSESVLVQLCSKNLSARYSMGIVAHAGADVGFIQEVVAAWSSGDCITTYDSASDWRTTTISIPKSLNATLPSRSVSTISPQQSTATSSSAVSLSDAFTVQQSIASDASAKLQISTNDSSIKVAAASASHPPERALLPRDDCSTVKVVAGDSCGSLAAECGITGDQLTQYNPQSNLCSRLTPGQHVCCSPGTLPDYSPKQNANGTCATYLIQSGDTCSNIAASNSLTPDQLNRYNQQTWGWMGCNDLQAAETMCLSSGSPPMPAMMPNAECGPQAPGTPISPVGTDLSTLNQCPLRACCNVWGQCGTTTDFCTPSKSPTGAPGTASQGTNGCISNCGTEIITGGAPSMFLKIGYFEAFNVQRPCLNQPIRNIDLSSYTHVHVSFATISTSWELDVSAIQTQFDDFVTMSGFKKILAVGGWAFSTDPSTYNIFRQAMAPDNRDTLASNIVSFLQQYELDGIDIDYEYPGEPDMPGIPIGTRDDSDNYLAFMKSLKAKMPAGKTISFTAPASFWYLKAFRLAEMAFYVDYIVYMTYDLHGQWDCGNKWSVPGCSGGNCLRSHVDITETINALSMITKAGVPASLIVVGVSSYGRSFQMSTPGCTGEQCTYTGPNSGAYAGRCTKTAGYISNAEIAGIIAGNESVYAPDGSIISISGPPNSYHDSSSDSDILVYNSNQWVAYMSESTKANRTSFYKGYNFLGTADWAVDLQNYNGDDGNRGSASVVTIDPSIWGRSNPSITCNPPCIFVLPPYPLGYTSTIIWPTITTTLLSSSNNAIYTVTTTIIVPQFTITDVSLQPITLGPTDTAAYKLNPVQSILPSSFIFTLPPNEATFPPSSIQASDASVGGPGGGNRDPNPTSSSTTIGAAIFPGVTFQTTPIPITIQPQPTYSILIPAPPIPPVAIAKGSPGPTCRGSGCGSRDCSIFGCSPGCGLFSCDGGCGIFGCGGGCGITGCVGVCGLGTCGGLSCQPPGTCGGLEGGGDGKTDPDKKCTSKVTASACTYIISSFSTAPMTTSSTMTETSCSTSTVCNGADTQTTETPGACLASVDSLYSGAAIDVGTMISGTLMPSVLANAVPPLGATGAPDVPYFGFSLSSATSSCTACYWFNGDEVLCSQVAGCIITTTMTSIITVNPTTTTQIIVPTTVSADCAFWVFDFFYAFEVYNIQGWAQDNDGKALLDQERGCGALTGWEFDVATPDSLAHSYFNLPFLIKAGCVERAIVSAGGPKLQCRDLGNFPDRRRRRDEPVSNTPSLRSAQSATYNYSASSTATSVTPYIPMTWGEGQTVTFTITDTTLSLTTITTTSTIANATTASIPGNMPATIFASTPLNATTTPMMASTTAGTLITSANVTSSTNCSTGISITSSNALVPATPPAPTQSGIASNCNQYYVVKSVDSCSTIESQFGITFQQFYAWNPAIGSDCTALWIHEAYCVAVWS